MGKDAPDRIMLDKGDVTIEKLDEPCEECPKPRTHAVLLDLRSAGMQIQIGRYCKACARQVVLRIQDGLPVEPADA